MGHNQTQVIVPAINLQNSQFLNYTRGPAPDATSTSDRAMADHLVVLGSAQSTDRVIDDKGSVSNAGLQQMSMAESQMPQTVLNEHDSAVAEMNKDLEVTLRASQQGTPGQAPTANDSMISLS